MSTAATYIPGYMLEQANRWTETGIRSCCIIGTRDQKKGYAVILLQRNHDGYIVTLASIVKQFLNSIVQTGTVCWRLEPCWNQLYSPSPDDGNMLETVLLSISWGSDYKEPEGGNMLRTAEHSIPLWMELYAKNSCPVHPPWMELC
jgi:hypothetical protein